MKLEIISPDKLVFSGNVESVILPGLAGSFEILPRHAAIISSLKEGSIIYTQDSKKTELKVDGGFAESVDDVVTVCVERVIS